MAIKKVVKTANALPDGFVSKSGGDFAPIHNFMEAGNEVLQGFVQGEVRTVVTKPAKGNGLGNNAEQSSRVMTVADSDTGEVKAFWESKALEGLFNDAKAGDEVYVKYTGPVKVKGRPKPMRGFLVGLKENGKKSGK